MIDASLIQSIVPQNADEAYRLAQTQPLTSITVDGIEYDVGILSDEQAAELTAWGTRIAVGTMTAEDHIEPLRAVREVLLAGDPDLDWKALRPKLKAEHILACLQENMRQATVRAFQSSHKGSA